MPPHHHPQVLLHGNTTPDEALSFIETAKRTLGSEELQKLPDLRFLQLRAGEEVLLRQHPSLLGELQAKHSNADDVNSAVEMYLQVTISVDYYCSHYYLDG